MNGHLYALKWLHSPDPPCLWDEIDYILANENCHLDALQRRSMKNFESRINNSKD